MKSGRVPGSGVICTAQKVVRHVGDQVTLCGYHFDRTCRKVQLRRRGLVFIFGILDLDVEKQELVKVTLRVDSTSSPYRKPSSTSIKTSSRAACM